MMFFSKWLVFSPSSGPGNVPNAQTPTHAAWHMVQHHLVLLSAINYYWMCLVSLCIQDAPLRICLVLTHLLFSRRGGGQCNPVWVALDSPTKTFKVCILQPDVFCYISPVCSDRKFESRVQLVGFVFDSLLCTTEVSNVQANLPLFPLWSSSVCCKGKDRLRSMMRTMIPPSFRRISESKDAQQWCWTIHVHYRSHGLVSGTATERPRCTRKRKVHKRYNFCSFEH